MVPFSTIVAQVLLFATLRAAAASSSSSSVTTTATTANADVYESVRTLDEYGQAVQLRNAQAAADQRGRLVLALQVPCRSKNASEPPNKICDDGESCTWVVSPLPAAAPSHHRRTRQYPPPAQAQLPSLLEAVTFPEPDNVLQSSTQPVPAVYLVCTGLHGDAVWLVQQLRQYAKTVAFTYNNYQPTSLAGVTSDLKRHFWNYKDATSTKNKGLVAWQPPCYDIFHNLPKWGRPLGIRTLVIGAYSNNSNNRRTTTTTTTVELVEPSGVVRRGGRLFCMGKHHAALQKELQGLVDDMAAADSDSSSLASSVSDADLERRIWEAFSKVVQQPTDGTPPDDHDDDRLMLQLDIVSSSGIETRLISSRRRINEAPNTTNR
jgi:20S proteasome alpha/beta subunit